MNGSNTNRRCRRRRRGRAWLIVCGRSCRFLFDCFTLGRRAAGVIQWRFTRCCRCFRGRCGFWWWTCRPDGRFGFNGPLQWRRLHHASVALFRAWFQSNQMPACSTRSAQGLKKFSQSDVSFLSDICGNFNGKILSSRRNNMYIAFQAEQQMRKLGVIFRRSQNFLQTKLC